MSSLHKRVREKAREIPFFKALKSTHDKETSQRFLSYIANFAANNEPGIVNNVEWHPVSADDFQVLKIDKG